MQFLPTLCLFRSIWNTAFCCFAAFMEWHLPQNSLPAGFIISAASPENMLLTRAMTCFTMYITVDILCFQILNILVTFKTSLLSGIMNFRQCIINQGSTPVMTIFTKSGRYKKMPQKQKQRDKYCKSNCKSWNLWRNIEFHM